MRTATPPGQVGSAPAHRAPAARICVRPGARPQRDLRADQRLLRPSSGGPAPQGQGRVARAHSLGTAVRAHRDAPPRRHPPRHLREGPPRHPPPQDHPPRRVRARRLGVPVLRRALEPHGRPRDPALQGRAVDLGEHRRVVRALQPPQGRQPPRQRRHAPEHKPAAPSPHVFIHVASPTIPTAWRAWLPVAAAGAAA